MLEPGGIATPIWTKALEQDYSFADKKYSTSIEMFKEGFIMGGTRGMDADKAADQIFRFITRKKPGARYIIARNRIVSYLETLIPDRALDLFVAKMFSMRY